MKPSKSNGDQSRRVTASAGRRAVAGFSLVEMLTVLTVIVVVLAIGIPSWTGMNSSGLRRAAVGKMMGVFDQARGMAITEGRNAYVVFAAPVPLIDQAKWGQACAIYVEDTNFNIVQRSPWIALPTGVAFKITATALPNGLVETSIMNRPLSATASPLFPVTLQTSPPQTNNVQLPYLKFDSTGAVDEQDPSYARVLMFLGAVNSAGVEVSTKNTGGQSALLDEVRLNAATGRAKYTVDAFDNLQTPTPAPTPTPTS